MYQQYNGRFEILAVNVGESQIEARGFQQQYDLSFPILLDEQEEVATLYGLDAYPTTYIIGRDGVIIEKIRGSFTEQTLKDVLAIYVGR
jgi:peroxiredoxin